MPTLAIGLLSGEYRKLLHVQLTTAGVGWLLLSCVVGTGISWAGFSCQTVISATAYTVVGVMNKMLTELCAARADSRRANLWIGAQFAVRNSRCAQFSQTAHAARPGST